MTKLSVNIHDAKTNLSKYIAQVQLGATVTVCKNGEPVAQILPFPKKKSTWDMRGIGKHMFKGPLRDDFNDELTDEELPGFGLPSKYDLKTTKKNKTLKK